MLRNILRSFTRSARNSKRNPTTRRLLIMERLEERQLLSAATLTSLRVSTAPITYGQTEILTATVTTTAPNSGTPTGGTVTFLNGNTSLGTAPLHSGTATLRVSTLPVGIDVLMANYSGDGANFADSATVIGPNSVITTVAGGGNPGDGGQATAAELHGPAGVAMDSAGDLFIADSGNQRIREVNHATGVITTVAGNGIAGYSGDNGPATAAELFEPTSVAVDSAGDLFIADSGNYRIREVDLSTGIITTIAGNGSYTYSGDNGPATAAALNYPEGVALNAAGDLFIADSNNERVREVNRSTGIITTIAGNGNAGYSGDNGPAIAADLWGPEALAVDAAGNLFIDDCGNNRIGEVNLSTGIITTVAGNGSYGYSGDNGQATAAELGSPEGVAVDSIGDLFIDDTRNYRMREVNLSTGLITTVAGNGVWGYGGDGAQATAAELDYPEGAAVDAAGDLFIADSSNQRIREIASGAALVAVVVPTFTSVQMSAASLLYGQSVTLTATVTVAPPNGIAPSGGVVSFFNGSSLLGMAALHSGTATLQVSTLPLGMDVVTANYSGDDANFAASSTGIGPNSVITTVAGEGNANYGYNGDGILATAAELNLPWGVAVDAAGDLFIADFYNSRIREVNHTTGLITTVAGTGVQGFNGDNIQATVADLYGPKGVAVDAAGNLFIAESYDEVNPSAGNRIREVNLATGVITTVAGNGMPGYGGDNGPATAAELHAPYGVAVDAAGDLFIADSPSNRVREVNLTTGLITTIAGNGKGAGTGGGGYGGDGGPATAAELNSPYGVAVNGAGDLFIADYGNECIREVNACTHVITTVAGNGTQGYGGDNGLASAAALNGPTGVVVDTAGNLFIVDGGNNRIREMNASTHVITTVVGNASVGDSGDNGPASAAQMWSPEGVAIDAAGDLFIDVWGNNRIREVTSSATAATVIPAGTTTTADASSTNFGAAGNVTLTAQVTANAPSTATVNEGSVTFTIFSDGLPVATYTTGAVSNGAVSDSVDLTGWNAGMYSIRAVYNPPAANPHFQSSASAISAQLAINAAPTNTVLNASAAAVIAGQMEILTVTVTAGAGTPSGGTVTFFNGNALLGTASLHAGMATLQISTLPAGRDILTASYSGSGNFAASSSVLEPNSVITTVAGNGNAGYNGDGIQATAAELNSPNAVAVDSAGDLFIADTVNNRIREVNQATGLITTVAGNGARGYSGDNGPATAAELNWPTGVAVDAAGDLFIADGSNNVVREVNHATGVITTVAGNGASGYSGDSGPATAAELADPADIAVDSAGNLFIADFTNNRIREVNHATGVITTVAGNGVWGYGGDNGQATAAELGFPTGVALDSAGDLFIADTNNQRVREVNQATGVITTVAGTGTISGGDNGQATATELNDPVSVAVDAAGNLFITANLSADIREVNQATGVITTIAGHLFSLLHININIKIIGINGGGGFAGDNGPATAAELDDPWGLAVDSAGNLFIADADNNRIRKVNQGTGVITTVAGGGSPGDGGPATTAVLYGPSGVAADTAGDLFIADAGNNRVREVNHATGAITTVAGNGLAGYTGDGGPATAAELCRPTSVTVDSAGDLFVVDSGNNVIREVNLSTGVITTVAGNGLSLIIIFGGSYGDGGLATNAELGGPSGVAVDAVGDLFIADWGNSVVREVNHTTGVITRIAGSYPPAIYPGTVAESFSACGIAVDAAGDLFIADGKSALIHELNCASGVMTTVAGNGTAGYSGDGGPATAAELNSPSGVAVDSAGNLFIVDGGNGRIREVNLSTGVITTVAGSGYTVDGNGGFAGDNSPATAAELNNPSGLAVDAAGDLFIADQSNNRIREVSAAIFVNVAQAPTDPWVVIASGAFFGPGTTGLAWQNQDTGMVALWNNSGGTRINASFPAAPDPAVWKLLGTGDFNGDGTTDLLWQNQNPSDPQYGLVAMWLMDSAGSGNVKAFAFPKTLPPPTWKFVGVGNFAGNGITDVAWRDENTNDAQNGLVGIWVMNSSGGVSSIAFPGTATPATWKLLGVGDFNGDGTADLAWQDQNSSDSLNGLVAMWLMSKNSPGATSSITFPGTVPPATWKLLGMADFAGNGTAGLAWQDQNPNDGVAYGLVATWLINTSGTLSRITFVGTVPPTIGTLLAIADFNQDGTADLVWQDVNSSDSTYGLVGFWLLNDGSWSQATFPSGINPSNMQLTVGNAVGDAPPDLIWHNLATGQVLDWQIQSNASVVKSSVLGTA